MQKTIFTILTNKKARSSQAIVSVIKRNFTAGAPWFDKPRVELSK